jgi:serine protease AprX
MQTCAQAYWKAGFTGKGVDVAVIDTGTAPVPGLATAGKLINGPDLSFESQAKNLRYLDTYGHGTHMAGIIAGRADAAVVG